jgi:hypothetical protein
VSVVGVKLHTHRDVGVRSTGHNELTAVLLVRQQRGHAAQPVPRLWNGRGAPLWRDSCLHTKEKTPPPDHPTGRSEGAPTSLTGRALLRSGRLWFRCCFGDIPRPARGDLGAARATALRPEGPCCPRLRRRRDCPEGAVLSSSRRGRCSGEAVVPSPAREVVSRCSRPPGDGLRGPRSVG